jgi:anti-anti-sigma regulatory factor
MAIQRLSKDVLCVELPSAGPKIAEELNTVNEMVSEKCTDDVIVDFFKVEVLNSWNISTLLALRSLLEDSGHQLVLFNVRFVTKCIFTVAGFRKVFVFAKNKESALKALQRTDSPSVNPH